MFLGLKLLGACALGVSCVVSAALLANKTSENYDNSPSVWKIANNPSFPILTCSNNTETILVSLKPKNNSDTLKKGEQIILSGSKGKNNESIDLQAKVDGGAYGAQDKWTLNVYASGAIRLMTVGLGGGHTETEKVFNCQEKVFNITKPKENFGGDWEKSVSSIEFKLGACDNKVCDIEINSDVGLKWKEGFKPKVVF